MFTNRILPVLLLALSIPLASVAEARKWRGWHYYGHSHFKKFGSDYSRRARAAERPESTRANVRPAAFSAVIDRLVRGCLQQALELRNWPFDRIARAVGLSDAQRVAFDALRGSVAAAAERLSAECPRDAPTVSWARLDTVEQAIDAATSAFAAVEPALQSFYSGLDDEQKARLLRETILSDAQLLKGERSGERWRRRNRQSEESVADTGASSVCDHLAEALRDWPIREIERRVRLSGVQRIAFYELVTSSLRSADKLADDCPRETALTPVGRVATQRTRLTAVRQATVAIRPALTGFYEALDQKQQVRFAQLN